MLKQFNAMIYYNSAEIDEAMNDIYEAEYLYELLLAMWLRFYPNTDKYDLAYIKGLAEEYAADYIEAKQIEAFNV